MDGLNRWFLELAALWPTAIAKMKKKYQGIELYTSRIILLPNCSLLYQAKWHKRNVNTTAACTTCSMLTNIIWNTMSVKKYPNQDKSYVFPSLNASWAR